MAEVQETSTRLTVVFRSSFFTLTGLKGWLAIGAIFAFGYMAWTNLIGRNQGLAILYGGGLILSAVVLLAVWMSYRIHPETCTFDLEQAQVTLRKNREQQEALAHRIRHFLLKDASV